MQVAQKTRGQNEQSPRNRSKGNKGQEVAVQEQIEIRRTLAQKLADALGESEPGPRWQLYRVVTELGGPAVVELLRETIQTQQQGGMLTTDGSRRRTNGGVFFALAKERMSPEERERIFPRMSWAEAKRLRKEKRRQQQQGQGQPGQPQENGSTGRGVEPQPVEGMEPRA